MAALLKTLLLNSAEQSQLYTRSYANSKPTKGSPIDYPLISTVIGIIIGIVIIATFKYWVDIPKLKDFLILIIGGFYIYGVSQFFHNITKWWLS